MSRKDTAIKMTGVRELCEHRAVKLAAHHGEVVIWAQNEGGYNSTTVVLDDLLAWIDSHPEEIEAVRGQTAQSLREDVERIEESMAYAQATLDNPESKEVRKTRAAQLLVEYNQEKAALLERIDAKERETTALI
jgi:hypothetical protein